jgi:hypothetical protein
VGHHSGHGMMAANMAHHILSIDVFFVMVNVGWW